MAPNDVHEDDWVSVPDETQSAQAIKDLRAQLQTSQEMAIEFATRMNNLQLYFDELREEVSRLQGVEDLAMSQRKKIKRVQKACDLLTEKVDAAEKKAANQEETIQRLQQTNQDLADKLSVFEKGVITQKGIDATKQTMECLGTKISFAEVEALKAEHGLHIVTHTRWARGICGYIGDFLHHIEIGTEQKEVLGVHMREKVRDQGLLMVSCSIVRYRRLVDHTIKDA